MGMLEQKGHVVAGCADIRGKTYRFRMIGGCCKQAFKGLVFRILANCNDGTDFACCGDGLESIRAIRDETGLLRRQNPIVQEKNRMSVRIGIHCGATADCSAGSGDVDDNQFLRQKIILLYSTLHDPCKRVTSSPRRKRHNHFHWSRRKGVNVLRH